MRNIALFREIWLGQQSFPYQIDLNKTCTVIDYVLFFYKILICFYTNQIFNGPKTCFCDLPRPMSGTNVFQSRLKKQPFLCVRAELLTLRKDPFRAFLFESEKRLTASVPGGYTNILSVFCTITIPSRRHYICQQQIIMQPCRIAQVLVTKSRRMTSCTSFQCNITHYDIFCTVCTTEILCSWVS